jgi:DNA polymerase III delta' subunit
MKIQDNTPEILKESVRNGRIFSNYLFVGPESSGKREAAKNFAKAINCMNPKDGKPCGACVSCKKIDKEIHPDVFFVETKGASSSIGIDRIREIIEKANLKPYEAKSKVFIINNAHSMNEASANAFLKTLEEPLENTVFILISRSKDLLLPTIVSRSHVIRFTGNASPFSVRGGYGPGHDYPADREGLKENLEFLISFFRDIFLYKVIGDKARLLNMDKAGEVKSVSHKFTAERLDYLIKKLITLRSYADYNVNPKIIIDVLKEEIG